jgi:DNA-binding MarR family transcriptional regulator
MAARNFSPSPDADWPENGRKELRGWLQVVLQIGVAVRAARRHLAGKAAACDLSEQEFLVLWLCDDVAAAHRGQRELAEAVGVSPAQMSGLVERLRVRNLLQFERCGTDRRRQVWQLTAAGQTLLTGVCQTFLSATGKMPSSLTLAEIHQLSSLLERWLPAGDRADDSIHHSTPDQGGPSSCAA